jgi:ABC-type dipeptide/oligopeptide/nickel transport system permease component
VYSIQPLQDFGLIFATTLLFTFIVVFANLAVDVLYAALDPRVRLG